MLGDIECSAAAYAEVGEFDKAVEIQKRFIAGLEPTDSNRSNAEARLKLYERKQPYRDE